MKKFIVNNRTDAWKTDINLLFTITNCQIVHSHSLTHMCLSAYWQWKLANERARISAVTVKNTILMKSFPNEYMACNIFCIQQVCTFQTCFWDTSPFPHDPLWDAWLSQTDCSASSMGLLDHLYGYKIDRWRQRKKIVYLRRRSWYPTRHSTG